MTKLIPAAIAALLLAAAAHAEGDAPRSQAVGYRLDRPTGFAADFAGAAPQGISFILPGEDLLGSASETTDADADAPAADPHRTALSTRERLDMQHDNPAYRDGAMVELGIKYRF